MIVADPTEAVAELVADQCERLAGRREVATEGAMVLKLARETRAELAVLSLELQRPDTASIMRDLRRLDPRPFVVVTYRELGLPGMERFGKLGVTDFVPHPIDVTEIFRAASRHFGVPFRRHERFVVHHEVHRLDGVVMGQTQDLSEGGMLMRTTHALTPGESLLLQIDLPDGADAPLRVRSHVLRVEGQAPAAMSVSIQFDRLRGKEHRRLVMYLEGLRKKDEGDAP